ncbi:MAG: hypothetical protein M1820_010584 [Bogoriella megaspora]|nr:MAG: hypothetical protein M1820_010584 [Bogoriella megaspora]
MFSIFVLFIFCHSLFAAAQQYAGDIISAYLPTIQRAEVAFFKIPDPTGKNNHLSLINYYSHGTNGQRIVESNIQRAVIVIHGLLRDPWNYENDTLNALAKVTTPGINQDSVAVIAPYFPNGDDKGFAYPWTSGKPANQGSTTNALVWSGSQWSAGANNQYPYTSTNTSAYYVLDTLIQYFDNATLFPNMKQIVLVGHSLGGQMLQRYAIVGPQLSTRSPVVSWVGNPDSLAWLSPDRPLSTADCANYDNYRDGYTNYNQYPMTYGTALVAQGRDALIANFQSKQIAYARGTLDYGDDSSGCSPFTTGQDRNERFFFFIKNWGPTCDNPASRSCDTVDLIPVSHDNGQMFGSPAGLARLFTDNFHGDGSRAYDFGYPRAQFGDDPYPDPSLSGQVAIGNNGTFAGNMTYQGCWTDQIPVTPLALPTLQYDSAQNTVELCTQSCVNAGFSIAGVQNATQCYCGNSLNSQSAVLTVDKSCRKKCPADGTEICGGNNRLSVFSKQFPTFA